MRIRAIINWHLHYIILEGYASMNLQRTENVEFGADALSILGASYMVLWVYLQNPRSGCLFYRNLQEADALLEMPYDLHM